MKSTILAVCAALVLSCNNDPKKPVTPAADSTSSSTSSAKTDDWVPVDSATAMQAMMKAGMPGSEQAMLAKDNGNWKAEITMWEKPGGTAMMATGTASNRMIMNGRYQQMTFKGNMMGMPFEGISTTGYDNARQVWVNTWVDNMSTGIMNMEGTWDDATKSATYTGQMMCPANGKMCEMKQVFKRVDDKTQVMEMYGPDMATGKPFKGMEMKLTKL